jgi:hypothetical protein
MNAERCPRGELGSVAMKACPLQLTPIPQPGLRTFEQHDRESCNVLSPPVDCSVGPSTDGRCHTGCQDFLRDADGDSYGDRARPTQACSAQPGLVPATQSDCDDTLREHWSDCGKCVDDDKDGYGRDCDLGLDCADGSSGVHADCVPTSGLTYLGALADGTIRSVSIRGDVLAVASDVRVLFLDLHELSAKPLSELVFSSPIRQVAFRGDELIVAEYLRGIVRIAARDPRAPKVVETFSYRGKYHGTYPIGFALDGDYMAVCDSSGAAMPWLRFGARGLERASETMPTGEGTSDRCDVVMSDSNAIAVSHEGYVRFNRVSKAYGSGRVREGGTPAWPATQSGSIFFARMMQAQHFPVMYGDLADPWLLKVHWSGNLMAAVLAHQDRLVFAQRAAFGSYPAGVLFNYPDDSGTLDSCVSSLALAPGAPGAAPACLNLKGFVEEFAAAGTTVVAAHGRGLSRLHLAASGALELEQTRRAEPSRAEPAQPDPRGRCALCQRLRRRDARLRDVCSAWRAPPAKTSS